MNFGSAFGVVPPSLDERLANVADQLESVVAALAALTGAPASTSGGGFSGDQAAAAANAVVGIAGPANADEIAKAIVARLAPAAGGTAGTEAGSVLAAVEQLTKTLDHRLRGLGQAFGSGLSPKVTISSVNVSETGLASEATLANRATEATLLGRASEGVALDIKRGLTDYEARLDYDGSNNLIYSGKALNNTATSATSWTIQKLSYTGANLTRVQVLTGAWDSRTSLGW